MIEIIKPPSDFHTGTDCSKFRKMLERKRLQHPSKKFTLDLTDVRYMDTATFRIVFDFKSIFTKILPPECKKVNEMYDIWVESKKGLSK